MQRWLAGGMIALAVVLSVGMVLGFRVLRDQQQLLIAQQELTAEALRQLTARADERPAPAANEIEWVPAEIRLEGAEPGEKVPPGFRVRMSLQEKETSMPPWEGTSDETGVVRFPRVRYGVYDVQIDAPWGEQFRKTVNVNPGVPLVATITSPSTAPEELILQVEFVVPESLQSRHLWIDFPIGLAKRITGTNEWTVNGNGLRSGAGQKALVGSDGRIRPCYRSDGLTPCLVYDETGDLAGFRWPGREYQINTSYLHVYTERPLKAYGGSEQNPFLLRLNRVLVEPDEVRTEIDPKARRLRIVLTERGEKVVQEFLATLDASPDRGFGQAGDIVIADSVFPPVPTKRP